MSDRMLAEFGSEAELVTAIRALRVQGYRSMEAYTPYASHDVEHALRQPRSRLPWGVLVFGLTGAGGAYFLQWLTVAYLYPLNVGGRPPHFPLGFLIITFEMGVLFSAVAAVVGVLILGRLLRLVDEVQSADGFASATRDRFWLELSMSDPRFHRERSRQDLAELYARRISVPGAPS